MRRFRVMIVAEIPGEKATPIVSQELELLDNDKSEVALGAELYSTGEQLIRRYTRIVIEEMMGEETRGVGKVMYNGYKSPVNVRKTPGYMNKPEDDILIRIVPGDAVEVTDGPVLVQDLKWYLVRYKEYTGWAAESGVNGKRLLVPQVIKLGKPFLGEHDMTQPFGGRPEAYARFSCKDVPLRGHNGLDFGLPLWTDILAADDGVVDRRGWDAEGYGNYVVLKHAWGESVYAHMNTVFPEIGVEVKKGEFLGKSGNTGNSTGPHLHFGIRITPYDKADGWCGHSNPEPFL
jgi:murein DD-endopeptidase MepM/ murein hydrolase activator NlpD